MTRNNRKELKAIIKNKNQLNNVLKKQIIRLKSDIDNLIVRHNRSIQTLSEDHTKTEKKLINQVLDLSTKLAKVKEKKWYEFIERKK